jgi:hypothetical protein
LGGTKRHLLVDAQGLVLKAKVVHAASIMDWEGNKMLLRQADTSSSPVSSTYGWIAPTAERTREKIGWRRLWGGVWI